MYQGMAHAVFVQNPKSKYNDRPGEAYHFPKNYRGMVLETVGDWIVFYEGRGNGGAFGYVAVQRVADVIPDPDNPNMLYALMDRGSLLQLESKVERADSSGLAYEVNLRAPDGRPMSGGNNTAAVRRITPPEFSSIVEAGLVESSGPDSMPRMPGGFSEDQVQYHHAELAMERLSILSSRPMRDAMFSRMVRRAYRGKCAISGLDLRNGGGRPEVQAAHIRPVSKHGPDVVQNGLALSGTLHWMFDRGLISVSEDYGILISHNKVPQDTVKRLINPGQRLYLPENPRDHPHPEYLRYHREEIFGRIV